MRGGKVVFGDFCTVCGANGKQLFTLMLIVEGLMFINWLMVEKNGEKRRFEVRLKCRRSV
jgi:hypothetical protein